MVSLILHQQDSSLIFQVVLFVQFSIQIVSQISHLCGEQGFVHYGASCWHTRTSACHHEYMLHFFLPLFFSKVASLCTYMVAQLNMVLLVVQKQLKAICFLEGRCMQPLYQCLTISNYSGCKICNITKEKINKYPMYGYSTYMFIPVLYNCVIECLWFIVYLKVFYFMNVSIIIQYMVQQMVVFMCGEYYGT